MTKGAKIALSGYEHALTLQHATFLVSDVTGRECWQLKKDYCARRFSDQKETIYKLHISEQSSHNFRERLSSAHPAGSLMTIYF